MEVKGGARMKKSIYSVVLSEDVVNEIDRMAYRLGTNRSGLINQILAEYVAYETPEKKNREILEGVCRMMESRDGIRNVSTASVSGATFQSAISYKYNPSVRYHVEMYRTARGAIGELRVSMRTQNLVLQELIVTFFRLWSAVEGATTGREVQRLENGKLFRYFVPRDGESLSNERISLVISEYIQAFDNAMKTFFSFADRPALAAKWVEKIYLEYYGKNGRQAVL